MSERAAFFTRMKNQNFRVRGKNLFLRYPQKSDLKEFSALNRASEKLHRGLVSPPIDKKSFTEFIEKNKVEANENLLICRNLDEVIIGAINLSQIFRKAFQNAYLGYYIGEKFAGKGHMTEAIQLVLRFAFRRLKLHRIEANIQPENLASIAVVRKNGFTKEGFSPKYLKIDGRWRDHERWAIIREVWVEKVKGHN